MYIVNSIYPGKKAKVYSFGIDIVFHWYPIKKNEYSATLIIFRPYGTLYSLLTALLPIFLPYGTIPLGIKYW